MRKKEYKKPSSKYYIFQIQDIVTNSENHTLSDELKTIARKKPITQEEKAANERAERIAKWNKEVPEAAGRACNRIERMCKTAVEEGYYNINSTGRRWIGISVSFLNNIIVVGKARWIDNNDKFLEFEKELFISDDGSHYEYSDNIRLHADALLEPEIRNQIKLIIKQRIPEIECCGSSKSTMYFYMYF